MSAPGRRTGLRTRLVLGNLLLVSAALATTTAVTALAGPPLFHDHLGDHGALPPPVRERAEAAFHVVNLVENLLAVVLAVVLTLVLSALVTRPVRQIITAVDTTARRFDGGDYTARLPEHASVPEIAALSATVNRMAQTIQDTEATRRRLLADLAHELRTPLAAVDGYLEAIEDGIETPDPSTIAIVRGEVRKLARLADDIRAVSAADERRLRLDLRPCSANDVIRDAAEALRPAYAAKGVALELVPAPRVGVLADPDRLGQVVTNLLGNALRHTPAGGRVSVDVEGGVDGGAAGVTGGGAAGGARITVRDTGEGVAAEHLPHLFERFYRAHPQTHPHLPAPDQGSGIGLTISRAIVTAHAGTIHLDSAGPGRGATATITLPMAPRD